MATFTPLRRPPNQPKALQDEEKCQQVTKVKTAGELLSTPIRSALLLDIKNKSNAPPGLYQQFYQELIEVVAEFYQDLPGITPPFNRYGGLLDHALHRSAKILEERLHHRFPENAVSEEQIAEEYSLWTYMLFTVALFRDIGKLHNCYQIYLCDSEGLMPRRWQPYDGAISHYSNYYRFKLIDTDRRHIDPSQWDKRAGPNLAYKLMTSEQFNWIHGNAAAYRIWWYELGDEEEEGRGGKGTKLAIANAEAAAIAVAMDLSSEAAEKAFVEKMEAAEQQSESMKDLPSLELDPSKANMDSVVEVTMVDYMVQQVQSDGPAANQIQVNNDGTMSITAQGVEAFAQSFPELAAQNGGAQGIYNQINTSAANTANATTATTNTTATANTNANPTATQSAPAQVTAQMANIIAKGSAAATLAAAAAMVAAANVAPAQAAVQPQVSTQTSRATFSMGG